MDNLVHDRECLHCKKFFECKGKPRGAVCVNFEEMDKDGKSKKSNIKENEI